MITSIKLFVYGFPFEQDMHKNTFPQLVPSWGEFGMGVRRKISISFSYNFTLMNLIHEIFSLIFTPTPN